MKFELTILGCGSATPTLRHVATAQILDHDGHLFLIDCGEGTQLQLRKYKVKFLKINHIFISHNHGDHCLGLPGLLSSFHLLGRTKEIDIYCQKGLKEAVEFQLSISHSKLRFPINWNILDPQSHNKIYEDQKLTVHSFPLKHRVPCCGFRFSEKPKPRNIKPELIEKYQIPVARVRQIKAGLDYTLADGSVIKNETLTKKPHPSLSYAFCSDTAYDSRTAEYVNEVDLLYHESTFLEEDAERAKHTFHSTAAHAAQVAKEAQVGKLLIGHYSARYRQEEKFKKQATQVFKNVELADEGLVIAIGVNKALD